MSLTAEHIQTPRRAEIQRAASVSRPASKLEVRLATTASEIEAAQRLRYRVFHEEMGAVGPRHNPGLDQDQFDDLCDHLLVIDPALPKSSAVVGTYRLLPGARIRQADQFYSASEFDITPMIRNGPALARLLECGRSCVAADYRSNRTVQLLWRGIATYMAEHNIEAMFGCASLPGTNIDQLAEPLAYLKKIALAPLPLRVRALPECVVPPIPGNTKNPDNRATLKNLPPLIKAYLRLGAWVGDDAAVDTQFDTTDVFILLPTNRIPARYYAHFDR
jgi:L-ornithine Nalpha-acyltransferase